MPTRLLIVHNEYIHRGGEEVCVERETHALRNAGLDVEQYIVRTQAGSNTMKNASAAIWGDGLLAGLRDKLSVWKPQILHAHNLFPLLSPRLFSDARRLGIHTVLTLHNFRPLCLNGLFLTPQNENCMRCAGGNFMHGIVRGCYRKNRTQSLGMAVHLSMARLRGWYRAVDAFIAPSKFLRDQFIAHGFPSKRFHIQGHFLPDTIASEPVRPQPYVLYLGRLSEEKGVRWLVNQFKNPKLPFQLHIAGDGPLRDWVQASVGSTISYLGRLTGIEKERELKHATALAVTSECYENFPLAVIEANAWGTPALVNGQGGMSEIVASGINGRAFQTHDADSFWKELALFASPDPLKARRFCQDFSRHHFSQEVFLKTRLSLYEDLLIPSRSIV